MASFSFTDVVEKQDQVDDEGAEVLTMPTLSFVEEAKELMDLISSWSVPDAKRAESSFDRFEKIVSERWSLVVST
jgi:hypothetical protein